MSKLLEQLKSQAPAERQNGRSAGRSAAESLAAEEVETELREAFDSKDGARIRKALKRWREFDE